MQSSTGTVLPRVQVLQCVSSSLPKSFANCRINDFRREERAQTLEALERIKHKQEELAEANNGTYDPRMSTLSAREEDVKIELQNIERRLVAYVILIQLDISSLTDALQKVLHTPSKHECDNWRTD